MKLLKLIYRRLNSQLQDLISRLRPAFIPGLTYGANCRIGCHVRFRVTDEGNCRLGKNVMVERFSEVTASGGHITIGQDSFIGQGCVIVARQGIRIGKDCLVAENVTIRDQNHRFSKGSAVRSSGFDTAKVDIGDNVWIGARACILAGVSIGDGAIIGAGSVVTKSLPPRVIAAGNPARVMREY